MRKLIAALMAGSMLVLGAACADSGGNAQKVDEDDTRLGPGDGNNEVGPGR